MDRIDTKRLRAKLLDLAVRGKLVPQDPNDEPASALLERIRAERAELVKQKKAKAPKGGDSVIYRGSDGSHYEKRGTKTEEIEVPYDLPAGWSWCRLATLSTDISYGVSNSAETAGKQKLLRITDIHGQSVDWESVPYTTVDEDAFRSNAIGDGDILFARIGATVGKTYLACDTPNNAVYASYLIRVRTCGVYNQYLINCLDSPSYWEQISFSAVGSGRPNVNGNKLAALLVPLPPLEEQRRIVAELNKQLSLVDDIECNQIALDDLYVQLRSKILDLAVRGQLTHQDPNDEPAAALLERIREERTALVAAGKAKAAKGGDSIIYRASDGGHYEKRGAKEEQIEVPFNLPDEWAWARLGTISDYGYAESAQPDAIPDAAWILDLEDIEKDSGRVIARKNKLERPISSAKRPFEKGQLLYSKLRPYLNKVLIADDSGYCTSEILPITLYGGILPAYMRHCLMSPYFLDYANQCAYGCKMPRLGTNDGCRALVPISPLAEQRRIVERVNQTLSFLA